MIFQDEPSRSKAVIAGLIVGTLLIYAQVGRFEFTNFDDDGYVTRNPIVQRGMTAEGVAWAFQSGLMGNWHPITCLSHMLDCELFGSAAGSHHLVNVAFHLANSVLLFLLLRRMTGSIWRSALVAALFAWHPLRVESVAWVSERKDVLSAFFGLLTLWAYVKYVPGVRGQGSGETSADSRLTPHASLWYGCALLCFALGLMSKPMLVTLPFVMLLLDGWPLQRLPGVRCGVLGEVNLTSDTANFAPLLRRLIFEKLPFFVLSFVACCAAVLVQRSWGAMDLLQGGLSLPERIANAWVSYARYLVKTFWSLDLAALYPHPGAWEGWRVAGSVILIVSLSLVLILGARRRPWAAVGWFWFVGMLVPVIGLVQVGRQSMADRYTYLPHIGLFIAIVWWGAELVGRFRLPKALTTSLCGAALIACLALSWRQTTWWHDSLSLFGRTLAVTRNNLVAEYNYAQALSMAGRTDEAVGHYRAALELQPDYFAALVNLGSILFQKRELAEATNLLSRAVLLQPGNATPRSHFGLSLAAVGDFAGAREQLDIAGSLGATNASAYADMGRTLLAQGRTAEAVICLRKGLDFDPDNVELLNNVAWSLATGRNGVLRNGAEAVRFATRACELTQFQATVVIGTLAAAFAEAGDFVRAVATAQRAIAAAERNGESELAEKNRELLRLYQSGQAFRESR